MFLIVGVKNLYAQGRANENQQNRTTDRPFLTHFLVLLCGGTAASEVRTEGKCLVLVSASLSVGT